MDIKILLKELEELNLPKNEYVIIASGPLAIRGIREAEDLDLLVTEKIWKDFSNKYPKKENGRITIGNIEMGISLSLMENKIQKMLDNPEIIEGFPFVKLEYVIEWKTKMGREKDLKDLELIKNYLSKNENLN